jgi:hypothetical protein
VGNFTTILWPPPQKTVPQKTTFKQPQKNTEKHRTKDNQLVHPSVNTRPDQSVFMRVLLWPFLAVVILRSSVAILGCGYPSSSVVILRLWLSVFSCGPFLAVVIRVLLWPFSAVVIRVLLLPFLAVVYPCSPVAILGCGYPCSPVAILGCGYLCSSVAIPAVFICVLLWPSQLCLSVFFCGHSHLWLSGFFCGPESIVCLWPMICGYRRDSASKTPEYAGLAP